MKLRHSMAELDMCYIQEAFISGAKAWRSEWDACFHLNFAILCVKDTVRKFT